MTDDEDRAEFDRMREQAVTAITDDVVSAYVGVIYENDRNEFYYGNAVDGADLRTMAARHL